MKRREFITLLGGAAAAWPLGARAQQPATLMPKIGWLATGDPASYRFSLAAFHDGLRALGYTEGRNITIEYKWAEGNPARLPQLADQLVRQNVEVIVAGGSIGAQAAKNATSLVPIVAAGTGDLVELGLVTIRSARRQFNWVCCGRSGDRGKAGSDDKRDRTTSQACGRPLESRQLQCRTRVECSKGIRRRY